MANVAEVLLNVGCGDQPLPGFVNLDLGRDADLKLDVRRGLPCADNTVDAIHSEHFVEHLTQAEMMSFLRECRRVLIPGGVVRVSTPDLAEVVRCYLADDWFERSGLNAYGYDWLANPCEMLNVGLRDWGHKWVVDERELTRLADLAGLESLGRCESGVSERPCLQGRETRAGAHLIMEFRKPPVVVDNPLPLVSVLIPAFNPRFFAEALDSVCCQSWPNLEILVGDDSSGPEIERLTLARLADDPRIVYHRNPDNLGEAENYRELLGRARGEYIKCLADDDLLEPSCIEVMVGVLARHHDISLVAAYRRLIDERGEFLPNTFNKPLADIDVRLAGAAAATLLLARKQNLIGEPTSAMCRRRDLAAVQPSPMSFGGRRASMNGDVAMWLTLMSKGDLALLATPLSRFRQHEAQSCRVEEYIQRAETAWTYVREDARRLGLWQGYPPSGGQVDAAELDPVVGTVVPEISLLVREARDLPELLTTFSDLAGEELAYPHEYVIDAAGPDPATSTYLTRAVAGAVNMVHPHDAKGGSLTAAVETAGGEYLVVLEPRALPPRGWLDDTLRALASRDDLAALSLSSRGPLAIRAAAWQLSGLDDSAFDEIDWADIVCSRVESAGLVAEKTAQKPDMAAKVS